MQLWVLGDAYFRLKLHMIFFTTSETKTATLKFLTRDFAK